MNPDQKQERELLEPWQVMHLQFHEQEAKAVVLALSTLTETLRSLASKTYDDMNVRIKTLEERRAEGVGSARAYILLSGAVPTLVVVALYFLGRR